MVFPSRLKSEMLVRYLQALRVLSLRIMSPAYGLHIPGFHISLA